MAVLSSLTCCRHFNSMRLQVLRAAACGCGILEQIERAVNVFQCGVVIGGKQILFGQCQRRHTFISGLAIGNRQKMPTIRWSYRARSIFQVRDSGAKIRVGLHASSTLAGSAESRRLRQQLRQLS